MQATQILYSTIYQCLSQLDQDPKGSGTAPTVLYWAAQLECDRLPLWSIHPCRKFTSRKTSPICDCWTEPLCKFAAALVRTTVNISLLHFKTGIWCSSVTTLCRFQCGVVANVCTLLSALLFSKASWNMKTCSNLMTFIFLLYVVLRSDMPVIKRILIDWLILRSTPAKQLTI